MKIYNVKEKQEYIEEIARLSKLEWAEYDTEEELNNKIQQTINKIKNNLDNPSYCKLVLLDNDNLVGFISIFPTDGDECQELTPWYATMYVKKEYRGLGYSKILNDAILKEAKRLGFKKIYLKSELKNYYEKFGAKYIKDLQNGEKLYYIDL
ncbi:MAG: GNAT family N-acetyltransferase [Bacilli bacterium]